jgi:magnesium-protoporphyrin IX monomethyl ester (oxidative) cyclase
MYNVALVNMPFAILNTPSLALTQLKAVVDERLGDRIAVEIHYLNHEFGHFLGVDLYQEVAVGSDHFNAGLGEWLFRQIAFPQLPDNSEEYFQRYYPSPSDENRRFQSFVLTKRRELPGFLRGLIETHRLAEADLIGLTTMFTQNVACFALARMLKEMAPDVLVVVGGANCEGPMGLEVARSVDHLDAVFSGPALKSFPEFLEKTLAGDERGRRRIRGVFSRERPAAAAPTEAGQPAAALAAGGAELGDELELDAVVPLAYGPFLDLLERSFPGGRIEPILLFETSRGCWWGERAHCTFCGLNGGTMSYRAMSPANAVRYIDSVFAFAGRCNRFNCVDNILPTHYLTEVLPLLSTPPGAQLFYEVKANLSAEQVRVLGAAGVTRVQPGIESLASSTLKLMRKGTTVFENLLLLKNCLVHGVSPEWNLLVGFPGEEEDVYRSYMEIIPRLSHLPPPGGIFPVRFDRFSPYFVHRDEYGLDLHPVDYYALVYPFPEERLANLAYYFMDHHLDAPYFLAMARWIDRMKEKVAWWWERWQGGGAGKAELYLERGLGIHSIYDSRSGPLVRHKVSDLAVEVLDFFAQKGKRMSQLCEALDEVPREEIESKVQFLERTGLLFREGERLFSLVIDAGGPASATLAPAVLEERPRESFAGRSWG